MARISVSQPLASILRRAAATPVLLVGCLLWGCDSADPSDPDPDPKPSGLGTISYDLTAPSASFDLPEELIEISGITLLADGTVGAIQDELGKIYIIDPSNGAVLSSRSFGEDGDYEDIEWGGGKLYVLRADGDLFEIEDFAADSLNATVHETGLKRKNDPEGLTFIPSRNTLLIACKGDPGDGFDEDEVRNVFEFDLSSSQLGTDPVLTMNRDTIDAVVRGGGKFAPAAIALHPLEGNLYVVSSDLRALVVYTMEGELLAAHPLSKDEFEQPEGLLFFPNGDMLISSEGVDRAGKLVRFAYAP